MSALAWGAKVSPEFRARVARIAARLDCPASWLMACMAFETGRTFDPAVRNPASTATGLIQFMEATAAQLNTTTAALARMSAVEQLDYVARYFEPYRGRLKTLSDCYMAILWPKAVGRGENLEIFAPGSRAYLANRGLDIDHDGAVTKAEAASFVEKMLAEGLQPENATPEAEPEPDTAAAPPERKTMPAIALAFLQPLLAGVLNLFSNRAQAAIGKATGADPETAGAFFNNLIAAVGTKVGVAVTDETTAIQAVGKLTSQDLQAKAAAAAELEAHALDYLDKIAPLLDKLQQSDRDRYDADFRSVEAARKAWAIPGIAPLARELANNARLIFLVATVGVVGILAYQVFKAPDGKIDGMMYGLLTILVYAAARIAEAPYRSIFGATADSQAGSATATVVNQASEKSRP